MSLEKIQKKKGKKSADPYVALLKEAYDKAVARDEARINKLQTERNPDKWRKIYDLYLQLDARQEKIKPVLPLYLIKENSLVTFNFKDYNNQIIDVKSHLVQHLYKRAKILLKSQNKGDIREAYNLLDELDRIDHGYKDVSKLMQQAHQMGTTYALVRIVNKTDKIIPKRLQQELLNFSSYGASNFWVDYHNQKQPGRQYDYLINLKFKQINISPDQEREKEIIEEKEIQDGYTYQEDANGNIVKDSLGNPIKIPRMIKVRSKVHLYQQHKEAQVVAEAEIIDNRTGQRVDNFPLQSQYVFEHNYATYSGDQRAIRNEYLDFLKEKHVPFPSTEQMVYDAAKDIKQQFKAILNKADFL
ncbi:MAG TPA: hypothetical protein ENK64_01355 [Flavobacteriales bacterium]|nr:hypothetical protein [Flavobacteriales bacterium]